MRKHKVQVTNLKVEEIEKALLENHGVVKSAANAMGVDRTALNRRVLADEHLAEIRREAFQVTVDQIESDFIEDLLKGKDKIRQIFFLKCHGKDRGWVERQELTGAEGEPLGQVVAPVRQMNADEWAKENLKVVG